MKISEAELRALLIAAPESAAVPVRYTGPEQRCEPRLPLSEIVQFGVEMQDDPAGEALYVVRSHDISRHGVSVLHSQPIAAGTRCRVNFITASGRFIRVFGHVASCRQHEGDLYIVGIRFDEPVELEPLLGTNVG